MPFAPWSDRQTDFANYFNPAYVAIMVHAVTKGYNSIEGGMSIALAFPGVAMVLQPDIRLAFPHGISTRFSKWLRDHPELRNDLLSCTQLLVPQVKESILTALRAGWLVTENGLLISSANGPTPPKFGTLYGDDQKAAIFVGRWLAKAGDDKQIYQVIGLRP